MKHILLLFFITISVSSKAQKIDSIYVNLYTDSLKKGTYNYINVDGLLSNGTYMPLDSNHIIFSSNYGKFYGNNLFIDSNKCFGEILINIKLKKNPAVQKSFALFIKTGEEEKLKTAEELMNEMKHQQMKSKKS